MSETRYWEIDRLAASRLLARLGIEATPANLEEAAIEFAEHRKDVQHWVAGGVQSRIVKFLETRSMHDFRQMDNNWANGFRAAEELVSTLSPSQLLDQPSRPARSKGQILRSMVRIARKR